MAVSRVGPMVSKRGKSFVSGKRPSFNDSDKIRRPLAVACVDITKDLIQTLLPFRPVNPRLNVNKPTVGAPYPKVVPLTW